MKAFSVFLTFAAAVAYVNGGCVQDLERDPAYKTCVETWAEYMLPFILDFDIDRYVTALCSKRSLRDLRCVWDYMEECPAILDQDMNEESVKLTCLFFVSK